MDKLQSKFEILQLIGKGADGRVYRARRRMDGKIVSIKEGYWCGESEKIPKEVANNLVISRHCGSGINKIHSYVTDKERKRFAMVMDYAPMDLFEYTVASQLCEEECRDIIIQVIEANLNMVENAGMSHMDVKMENILIDPSTRKIKLCDFSNCAPVSREFISKIDCGTVCYMSPETLFDRKFYPTRSIVWCIGILCYVLLHPNIPWERYEKNSLLTLEKELSSECQFFIRKCLEPDVRLRPDLRSLFDFTWFSD